MKIKHLFSATAALTILLAGCGSQEKSDNDTKHEEKTKKDDNQKTEKKESNSNSTSNSTSKNQSNENSESKKESNSNVKPVSQLTPQEKVALALYAPKSAEFTVTPSELLNHSYVHKGNGGDTQRSIQQLSLPKASPDMIPNAPSNMKFYATPYDSRGPFALVVGISDTQVLISGTQGINPYQHLVNMGGLYDVKDLYNQYKDKNFQQVANLITFTESSEPAPKESDSSNDSESESNSSDSGEKVTRANVIDKVEDYEGHNLDTSTYTYKEPEQKSDGSWGFSFVDKSGNLAGSYIVHSDGSVEKFDAKGQPE
ncbi:hypothetical protein CD149_05005 [Staphylococcus condimenti]|uniref:Uncharacterized protein n=1 Tax=Staphylococcus condimenti TaxID=70255 RepID=A0A143PDL4_9STAP|nr:MULTISPECIES: hypothetical protein [Staphylococcus]AMY05829.1 hypothetical protein A4G25_07785 [Staphylococcus condimenti]APR62033.1 hypothetical protein BTZ13_12805 [Staphylococcus condimenti]MDK8646136.1 hypothetical protein [Staphylococcus condimenti]OFP02786.1 hypothetical protein HMPREF3007_08730 [Staphylococcus sp. HMSC065E08]PNZ61637.1 hypothetical protein CD149_05005 [Staphylococcus condimenti]